MLTDADGNVIEPGVRTSLRVVDKPTKELTDATPSDRERIRKFIEDELAAIRRGDYKMMPPQEAD